MNGSTAVLVAVTTANLVVSVGTAVAAYNAKREMDQEIADLKNKTNKTVNKLKDALEDLEV